jgi:hypothetical protein
MEEQEETARFVVAVAAHVKRRVGHMSEETADKL